MELTWIDEVEWSLNTDVFLIHDVREIGVDWICLS